MIPLRYAVLALILLPTTPAIAGKIHRATAPTLEAAAKAAQNAARDRAKSKKTCYRPVEEKKCKKVTGGFRCQAASANHWGSCQKKGYIWFERGREWTLGPIPIGSF